MGVMSVGSRVGLEAISGGKGKQFHSNMAQTIRHVEIQIEPFWRRRAVCPEII
jgi:hypothetical protein